MAQTKNEIRKREQVEKEAACQTRYKEFYMFIVVLDNKHSKLQPTGVQNTLMLNKETEV